MALRLSAVRFARGRTATSSPPITGGTGSASRQGRPVFRSKRVAVISIGFDPAQIEGRSGAPNALAGHWRRTVVATLPPYLNFEALQAIPGGVAALVQTATEPGAPGPSGEFSTKLMVYRYGKVRTF